VKFEETSRESSENVKTNKIKFFQQNEKSLDTNEIENKEDWKDEEENSHDEEQERQERRKQETRAQDRICNAKSAGVGYK